MKKNIFGSSIGKFLMVVLMAAAGTSQAQARAVGYSVAPAFNEVYFESDNYDMGPIITFKNRDDSKLRIILDLSAMKQTEGLSILKANLGNFNYLSITCDDEAVEIVIGHEYIQAGQSDYDPRSDSNIRDMKAHVFGAGCKVIGIDLRK